MCHHQQLCFAVFSATVNKLFLTVLLLHCVSDVLRSQLARIRILEEEVKASSTQELDALNARDKAIKEVQRLHGFVLL